jgi:CheY-like chemotaxis protein
MAIPALKPEERTARVSALLRQVDEDVKAHNLDQALEHIRRVYEYDIKNIYARAYEERILIMMMEKEREVFTREAQQKAAEHVDQEVKRRLKDFYKQQELEALKRQQEEKKEQALEERARKASVNEVQDVVHKDISAIEKDTARRIEELEKKFLLQIQNAAPMYAAGTALAGTEQIRAEYEAKFEQYKKQVESAEEERKKIQEDAFLKMKEEQKRTQEELSQHMEEERQSIITREQEKTKQRELDAYRTLMLLMIQLAVPAEVQSSILQSLKISFSISDTEHMDVERTVQVSAYIEAVRTLWQSGSPSEEDMMHLKNLQQFFKIADAEHDSITKRVKKELGMPDETAVIVVIDDDPSIRKYVEHILKKTYRTVITAASAETALPEIEKIPPALIISDVNLGTGVMSGFTFYEKIVSGIYGEKLKSIAYVLMSSMEDEFFLRSAKQLGVKAYLPKPFTRESLEAAIKSVLG